MRVALVLVLALVGWALAGDLEELPAGGWVEIPLLVLGIITAGKKIVQGAGRLLELLGLRKSKG